MGATCRRNEENAAPGSRGYTDAMPRPTIPFCRSSLLPSSFSVALGPSIHEHTHDPRLDRHCHLLRRHRLDRLVGLAAAERYRRLFSSRDAMSVFSQSVARCSPRMSARNTSSVLPVREQRPAWEWPTMSCTPGSWCCWPISLCRFITAQASLPFPSFWSGASMCVPAGFSHSSRSPRMSSPKSA